MTNTRILLGLSLLLLLTGCPEKEVYPVIVPMSFLLKATITPTTSTMQRGDTLWLEVNFSDSLLNRHNGRRYRVRQENLLIQSSILFKELIGIGKEAVAIAPTFRLVEKIGSAQLKGALSSTLEPVYDGRHYRARIGLIPTKAGVTAISLLVRFLNPATGEIVRDKLMPFIQLAPTADGQEQKATLEDSFYAINDGKANNFDLFRQHTKAFALESGTPAGQVIYEQQSTFTVEVK